LQPAQTLGSPGKPQATLQQTQQLQSQAPAAAASAKSGVIIKKISIFNSN
jgi:hypothetical protein